jgi:uncharacterized membrane protein YkvA (DUF1232 family)
MTNTTSGGDDGFSKEEWAGDYNENTADDAMGMAGEGRGGSRFSQFWHEVATLGRLAKSVAAGEYELETPKMIALFGGLAYVVSPIDVIPDPIPILGFTDDAAVVAIALSALTYEVVQFREWERAQAA